MPEKISDLERLLQLDADWRREQAETDRHRKRRNEITQSIAAARKKGQDVSALMKEAEAIPDKIKAMESKVYDYKQQADQILLNLPNLVHESVPVGKDENDNVEVKKWGTIPDFHFKPLDHIDLGLRHGLIDVEKAGQVAGARFYYLRDDLVLLNIALMHYGLDFIAGKGFQLFQPPNLLHRNVVAGAVALADFEDVIYKVEGKNFYSLGIPRTAFWDFTLTRLLKAEKLHFITPVLIPALGKQQE